MRPVTRRGATLVELLVALALASLVATVALSTLRHQLRATRSLVEHQIAESATIDGWHLLANELAGAHGIADSAIGLIAAGDSLLELWAARGMAIVCDVGLGTLTVVSPAATDPRAAQWAATPRPGDRLVTPAAALSSPVIRWEHRDVLDAPQAARCPTAPNATPVAGLRWPVAGAPATVGAPARIVRRTQYRLYRTTDGAWALGQREWNGATWSTTQPVLAPLLPPTGGPPGLRLRAEDSTGTPLGTALVPGTTVRAVRLTLRAGRTRSAPGDSLHMTLRVGAP